MPNARLFEVFRAVGETGSATRAAATLNTTQPNVTRSIIELERHCGFKLFDRGRFGMRLTAEGSRLLISVRRNFSGMQAILRTVHEIRDTVHGSLWCAALPVIAEGTLGMLLSRFAMLHPDVAIKMASPTADQVLNAILSEHVEFGAIFGPPPADADMEIVPLAHRSMVLVMSPDHLMATRDHIDFRDLDGESIVHIAGPHNIRAAVEMMLLNHCVRPRITHEVSTQRAVARLVQDCDCIGFIDSETAQSLNPSRTVVRPVHPVVEWTINLVYFRGVVKSRPFEAFLDWLKTNLPPTETAI